MGILCFLLDMFILQSVLFYKQEEAKMCILNPHFIYVIRGKARGDVTMPRPDLLLGPIPWFEAVYTLIIMSSCFIIYIKTKELYELTTHTGIRYFRNAFLFLGIAYFLRFLTPIFRTQPFSPTIFFSKGFFLVSYVSSVAVLSLLWSVLWKKYHKGFFDRMIFLHAIAVAIALVNFVFRVKLFVILFNTFLVLLAAILSYYYRKSDRKSGFSQFHFVYLLLFIFWILNFAARFYFRSISTAAGLTLHTLSTALFLIILYRVLKITHVE
jgi:hypothetical protein